MQYKHASTTKLWVEIHVAHQFCSKARRSSTTSLKFIMHGLSLGTTAEPQEKIIGHTTGNEHSATVQGDGLSFRRAKLCFVHRPPTVISDFIAILQTRENITRSMPQ